MWADRRRADVQVALYAREIAYDIDRRLTDASLLQQTFLASRRPEYVERANAVLAAVPKRIEELRRLARSEGWLLDPASPALEQALLISEALQRSVSEGGEGGAYLHLRDVSSQWAAAADVDVRHARRLAENSQRTMTVTVVGLIGAALLLSIALGWDAVGQMRVAALERRVARAESESLSRDLAVSRRELELVNERLALALAAARIVVFQQDASLRHQWVSRGEFGLAPEEFIGRSDAQVFGPQAGEEAARCKRTAMEERRVARCEISVADRGAARRLEIYASPMLAPDGDVAGVLGAIIDVTERRLDRESNRWLMSELSHRTQNLLAIVQSMARHTARAAPDFAVFMSRFRERLAALSACHHLLVRSSFRGVMMEDLVRSQLLDAQRFVGERVHLEGPSLLIRPDAAQTLAMALSELASNAQAFGALSGEAGQVDVRWRTQNAALTLTWLERDAQPGQSPARSGFGSVIITRMIPRALAARVVNEPRPDGWLCEMTMPLANVTAPGPKAA